MANGGLDASSHASARKARDRCHSGASASAVASSTSTSSSFHAGPNPELSCPIFTDWISPRNGDSNTNTSVAPRAKLSADVSSGRRPVDPRSPKISTNTLASVPDPRSAEVRVVTLYRLRSFAGFGAPSDAVKVMGLSLVTSASHQNVTLGAAPEPLASFVTSSILRCQSEPPKNPAPSCATVAETIFFINGPSARNVSTAPRLKSSAEVSRGNGPIATRFPSSSSPTSASVTFASVPAPRTSEVCVTILYPHRLSAAAASPGTRTCDVRFGGLSSANHRFTANAHVSSVAVLVISSDAQCHDASSPKKEPLLSCPRRTRMILPTSGASTLKTSFFPRRKLSAELSKSNASVSPFSPKSTMETPASVPAPLKSEVSVSITYRTVAFFAGSDVLSKTLGVFPSSQSSWSKCVASSGAEALATETARRCHAAPRPELSILISMPCTTPTSLASIRNSSTRPRSKLFAEFSRLKNAVSAGAPSASPNSRAVTAASVPAHLLSEVCTVILYFARPPPPVSASSVTGAFSLTQSSQKKNTLLLFAASFPSASRTRTSTEARCQSDPTPEPSCPISTRDTAPTSTSRTTNTSSALRSKLLESFSRTRVAVVLPSAPINRTLTLASVPAQRTSDVRTVTLYARIVTGCFPAGASATCDAKCGSRSLPIQKPAGKVTASPVFRLCTLSSATCHDGSPISWDSSWPSTTCVMAPTFRALATVKESSDARRKLSAVVSSVSAPVSPRSPKMVTETAAFVPASCTSLVCASMRYAVNSASGSSCATEISCVVLFGGSFLSNHASTGKWKRASGLVRSHTATWSHRHPLPIPDPSWPISIATSSPRSGMGPTSNSSSAPRSKLFEESFSFIAFDRVSFPSFTPIKVTRTLASVPANITSEVIVSTP